MDNRMTDERPAPELLPCPFCSSTNIDPAEWSGNDGKSGPGCGDCGALGESIEAWNRRAPVAALAVDGLPALPMSAFPGKLRLVVLDEDSYTADQMRQYALDAIAAEHLTRDSAVRAASSAYQDHRKEEE